MTLPGDEDDDYFRSPFVIRRLNNTARFLMSRCVLRHGKLAFDATKN